MRVIDFLASQLDREVMPHETQAQFEQHMEFWNLCLAAREMLLDEKAKPVTPAPVRPMGQPTPSMVTK